MVTESFAVAHNVLGSGGTEDLLSPGQKKRLEESSRKRRAEMSLLSNAGIRRGPLLNMAAAGGKKSQERQIKSNQI